jgi:ribonuclease J
MGDGLKLVASGTGRALFYQPRGGCNLEGIGSNCTLLVCGAQIDGRLKGDAILIDLGAHPARWTPEGMTQSFPDIRDLLSPESPAPLRAIFLTHAHADHDEAVVRYCEAGFRLPPIYGERETLEHLRAKLRGCMVATSSWPELREIAPGQRVETIPGFAGVEAVAMGHTRPALGFLVKAAGQGIFLSADFKLDQTTLTRPTDMARLHAMKAGGEVDLLCLDSTRAGQDGHTVPEAQIRANRLMLADKFPNHRLNLIISGHNDETIAGAAWLASQTGRFLVHHGTAIETSLRITNAGPQPLHTLVNDDELQVFSARASIVKRLSPSHVLNVLAGINGEKLASFARVCRGESEHLRFGAEDVVLLCGSLRPWNKGKLEKLADLLRAQGVEHIYFNNEEFPLHATGHEQGDGLVTLARHVGPKQAIVGLHGSEAQREALCRRFTDLADLPEVLRVDNGQTLRLDGAGVTTTSIQGPALIQATIRHHGSARAAIPQAA